MADVKAQMAGTVLEVLVAEGQAVEAGQDLVCLESMKMQMFLQAEQGGTVSAVKVGAGDFVNEGDTLIVLA
ncbi:MAG: biotin/lipoyl-containing protein [Candidatus Sericytochromatia bacterium]|nr:biotin/lipoyl-containing protein [Candidatus Sericytochromatia bacterium]